MVFDHHPPNILWAAQICLVGDTGKAEMAYATKILSRPDNFQFCGDGNFLRLDNLGTERCSDDSGKCCLQFCDNHFERLWVVNGDIQSINPREYAQRL